MRKNSNRVFVWVPQYLFKSRPRELKNTSLRPEMMHHQIDMNVSRFIHNCIYIKHTLTILREDHCFNINRNVGFSGIDNEIYKGNLHVGFYVKLKRTNAIECNSEIFNTPFNLHNNKYLLSNKTITDLVIFHISLYSLLQYIYSTICGRLYHCHSHL